MKVVCLATIRWLKYDEMLTMAVEWLVLDVTRLQRDLRYAHFTLIATVFIGMTSRCAGNSRLDITTRFRSAVLKG